MSKAILVIDMPESCAECRISCKYYYSAYRNGTTKSIKPDNCPLKKVPKKDTGCYFPDEQADGFKDGWNACIDEILGGNKNE